MLRKSASLIAEGVKSVAFYRFLQTAGLDAVNLFENLCCFFMSEWHECGVGSGWETGTASQFSIDSSKCKLSVVNHGQQEASMLIISN